MAILKYSKKNCIHAEEDINSDSHTHSCRRQFYTAQLTLYSFFSRGYLIFITIEFNLRTDKHPAHRMVSDLSAKYHAE